MLDYQTAMNVFLDSLRRRGCSENTIKCTRNNLQAFFVFLERRGKKDLKGVTPRDLQDYAEVVYAKPWSPGYQHNLLKKVEQLFGLLAKEGLILISPLKEGWVLREVPRRLPRILSKEEVKRLLSFPCECYQNGLRDRAILELLYSSGLRLGEVVGLKPADVELDGGLVMVREGKGRKDRVVPLGAQAIEAVRRYVQVLRPLLEKTVSQQEKTTSLFLGRKGKPLGKCGIQEIVWKYARLAGIKKRVYPHLLRHTCATHLLQGGASLQTVQQLLGHSLINTTQRYTQVTPSELKKWYRRSHPQEKWLCNSKNS